jgi:hypothetical protein
MANSAQVEAKNLQPFTQYYYQFSVCGSSSIKSPLGRTKTSPGPDDDVAKVGLAVYSCSNYPNGYFNAYGNAARKDKVDYVVSLQKNSYGWGRLLIIAARFIWAITFTRLARVRLEKIREQPTPVTRFSLFTVCAQAIQSD